jgi:hypothetical protein
MTGERRLGFEFKFRVHPAVVLSFELRAASKWQSAVGAETFEVLVHWILTTSPALILSRAFSVFGTSNFNSGYRLGSAIRITRAN